jgi:hypothetical protein
MSKRITVLLDKEAAEQFESLLEEANDGFEAGRITASDLVNEIIATAKLDLRSLQLKHSDLRRSLKVLSAREDIDVEKAIKILSEMRGRVVKRRGHNEGGVGEC